MATTTTTITNRVSLNFLAPVVRITDPKSSRLKKPASVCFSKIGSSIAPRLALVASSSLNQNLFAARGLPRLTRTTTQTRRRVRASSNDAEEDDEKRPSNQLFSVLKLVVSVLKLLINWYFALICLFFGFFWFTWLLMILRK